MLTSTFSNARQNLASTMDMITSNHTPITITRQNKASVVMLSLEDYNSMNETMYLMQSTTNANRLNQSINDLENGLGIKKDLIEV